MPEILVVIPTYNEMQTLPGVLDRVRAAVPQADVLVVDDASPDGTGQWADARAAADPAVHVLHRPGKQGLGPAYVAGFTWALDHGYGRIVEMDADGSHLPEQLRRLLAASYTHPAAPDLVIGSRWVPGGHIENWPWYREWLSKLGNLYTRTMLGFHVQDATGGYRVFTADALAALDLDAVASQGYCFQVDMTRRVIGAGGTVLEVPITFVEREAGYSKMSRSIVIESLWRTTAWGLERMGSGRRK